MDSAVEEQDAAPVAPATPVAATFTSTPAVEPMRLLSLSQRIGRVRFLVYTMVGTLICAGVNLLVYFACLSLPPEAARLLWTFSNVSLIKIMFPMIIFVMTIRRLHDINRAGWWSMLIVVPFVNIALLFIEGSEGNNRYGAPPPPNTPLLNFTAIGLPLALLALYVTLLTRAPEKMKAPLKGPSGLQQYR